MDKYWLPYEIRSHIEVFTYIPTPSSLLIKDLHKTLLPKLKMKVWDYKKILLVLRWRSYMRRNPRILYTYRKDW
jgi:hypothetical protein